MLDGAEYSSPSEYYHPDMNMSCTTTTTSKKRKSKNKIRFSDEQIRSLEVMFESETKLEPRKKVELAKELGLQPRQVAIWFQNKRARWKSKQIEKDYSLLLADYNSLSSQFDNLKKENQSLLSQLQKLKNEMVEKRENSNQFQNQETAPAGNISSTSDEESDYKKMEFDVMNVRSKSFEGILSDEDNNSSSIKTEFLGLDDQDQNDLLQMVEPAPDSSLTSAEEWGSLDSDDLIHQPAQSCQWWDFWS